MSNLTIFEETNESKKKWDLRKWVIGELKKFEMKYGLGTDEFTEKWRSNIIPEPENQVILEDFLEWDGLTETFEKFENKLKELEEKFHEWNKKT